MSPPDCNTSAPSEKSNIASCAPTPCWRQRQHSFASPKGTFIVLRGKEQGHSPVDPFRPKEDTAPPLSSDFQRLPLELQTQELRRPGGDSMKSGWNCVGPVRTRSALQDGCCSARARCGHGLIRSGCLVTWLSKDSRNLDFMWITPLCKTRCRLNRIGAPDPSPGQRSVPARRNPSALGAGADAHHHA